MQRINGAVRAISELMPLAPFLPRLSGTLHGATSADIESSAVCTAGR